MQATSFEACNATQAEFVVPTYDYPTWTQIQKNEASANPKAMNMLFYALDRNEFNRVSICTTAYQIWETLKVIHEGTNKVKQTKIPMPKKQFQNFRMRQNESINDIYSRFQDIHHALIGLGERYTDFDRVSFS